MTTAFALSLDQALVFFQLCEQLNLKTEEERVGLLQAMAKNKNVERVWSTKRSKEELIADLAKHYKVAKISTKKENKCS